MFFLFVPYGNHALNKVDNWTKTVKDFAIFYAGVLVLFSNLTCYTRVEITYR